MWVTLTLSWNLGDLDFDLSRSLKVVIWYIVYMWVACPCCWTVPRFPKAACFRKSCGRSLAHVCSSLIFSGFRNSAICISPDRYGGVGGWERLAVCVASGLFLYIATLTQFSEKGWFRMGARPVSVVFDSHEVRAKDRAWPEAIECYTALVDAGEYRWLYRML